jgi:hypothetical protein
MLRLKKHSNFLFVSNFIWGYSKCVQIVLFVSWNNFDSQCLFLIDYWISRIFFYHCSICVLKVAGVAPYRSWTQTSVQDLNRAAPATFRTQIEHIRTHFEQPQKRFKTKWNIWTLLEPLLKKFKWLLKIKERSKKI